MTRGPTKRRRPKDIEFEMLTARVDGVKRSYFISDMRASGPTQGLHDEAITEVEGRIETASERHQKIIGDGIKISLVCAQRYQAEHISEGTKFFGSLNIRSGERSALVYLPALPFWQLPAMLTQAVSYIQLRFTRVQYGTGELTDLFVGPLEAMS